VESRCWRLSTQAFSCLLDEDAGQKIICGVHRDASLWCAPWLLRRLKGHSDVSTSAVSPFTSLDMLKWCSKPSNAFAFLDLNSERAAKQVPVRPKSWIRMASLSLDYGSIHTRRLCTTSRHLIQRKLQLGGCRRAASY
jgi:hypothetical protein